jgi:biopolymer transport protein ExbB/TolQ
MESLVAYLVLGVVILVIIIVGKINSFLKRNSDLQNSLDNLQRDYNEKVNLLEQKELNENSNLRNRLNNLRMDNSEKVYLLEQKEKELDQIVKENVTVHGSLA